MPFVWDTVDTPIGDVTLVGSETGLRHILLPSDDAPRVIEEYRAQRGEIPQARQQITEYFNHERTVFTVELDWSAATGFRREVLQRLAQVPFGETTTYGQLGPARAVGGACGANPLPIIVPCHRVLRADGALGGYRGGKEMKRALLRLEGHDV